MCSMKNEEQPPLDALGNAVGTTPVSAAEATSVYVERLPENVEGVPDTLPEQFCPNCKIPVKPRGRGLCPKCGRVLKQSFLGRKHPVNVLRKKQIEIEVVADYKPD